MLIIFIYLAVLHNVVRCCEFSINTMMYNATDMSFAVIHDMVGGENVMVDNYFLNIQFNCVNPENTPSFMVHQISAGFQPIIAVHIIGEHNVVTKHILDTFLVENGCYGYNINNSFNNDVIREWYGDGLSYPLNERSLKLVNQPNNESTNCMLFWLSKLPVSCDTKVVDISVKSNGLGEYIYSKSIVFHVNSFMNKASNLSLEPLSINETFEIVKMEKSKHDDWFILLSNGYLITSSTEFLYIKTMKLDNIISTIHHQSQEHEVCLQSNTTILDLLLADKHLYLATKYGLLHMDEFFSVKTVLKECIESVKLVIDLNDSNDRRVVLLNHDRSRLYWRHLASTESFIDIKNIANESVVEWFAYQHAITKDNISIVCLSSNDDVLDEMFALVSYIQNYVSVYKLIQLKVVTNDLWLFEISSEVVHGVYEHLSISSADLCIYGENLACSINRGATLTKYSFEKPTAIYEFISLGNGRFIFVANKVKVWFGISSSSVLRELPPVYVEAGWNHLVYFLDSHQQLKQLLYSCHNSKCKIKFSIVNYPELLAHSQVESDWNHVLPQINCPYLSTCHDFSPINEIKFQNKCPYKDINFFMEDSNQLSRIQSLHVYNDNSYLELQVQPLHEVIKRNIKHLFGMKVISSSLDANEWNYDVIDFPEQISLQMNECTMIKIQVVVHKFSLGEFKLYDWSFKDIELYHYSSTLDSLSIVIQKVVDELNATVYFHVKICDRFHKYIQSRSGSIHFISKLSFHVLPNHVSCSTLSNGKSQKSLRIIHSCPSRTSIRFDATKSKAKQRHYCEEEFCFLYDHVFLPVFMLIDDVTNSESRFQGTYNLTVIGGGVTMNDVHVYSQQDQRDYNTKSGATLIWAPSDAGFRWLCGSSSPCGGITPVFPNTPVYYFLLQFTNRDIDHSFCDYTFNFTIKLHGMPPDGLYPSLFIVLLTISILAAIVLITYVIETKYPTFFANLRQSLLHCKLSFCSITRTVNKIDATNSSKQLSDDKVQQWMNEIGMQEKQVNIDLLNKGTSMSFITNHEDRC